MIKNTNGAMWKLNKSHLYFNKEQLVKLKNDTKAAVEVKKCVHHLYLHPIHLNDPIKSIKEVLDLSIARYDRKLGAIIMAYDGLKLLDTLSPMNYDSCFLHVDIEVEFYLFNPKVGDVLNGIVNKKSTKHVGGLVHGMFNVSLTKPAEEDDWLGFKVHLGQEIQFKVTFVQLDDGLPYIRAQLLSILSDDSGFTSEELNNSKKVTFSSENDNTDDTSKSKKKKSKKRKVNESAAKEEEPHEVYHDDILNVMKLEAESVVDFSVPKNKNKHEDSDMDIEEMNINSIIQERSYADLSNSMKIEAESVANSESFSKKKKKKKKLEDLLDIIKVESESLVSEDVISKKHKKNKHKNEEIKLETESILTDKTSRSKKKQKQLSISNENNATNTLDHLNERSMLDDFFDSMKFERSPKLSKEKQKFLDLNSEERMKNLKMETASVVSTATTAASKKMKKHSLSEEALRGMKMESASVVSTATTPSRKKRKYEDLLSDNALADMKMESASVVSIATTAASKKRKKYDNSFSEEALRDANMESASVVSFSTSLSKKKKKHEASSMNMKIETASIVSSRTSPSKKSIPNIEASSFENSLNEELSKSFEKDKKKKPISLEDMLKDLIPVQKKSDESASKKKEKKDKKSKKEKRDGDIGDLNLADLFKTPKKKDKKSKKMDLEFAEIMKTINDASKKRKLSSSDIMDMPNKKRKKTYSESN